MPVSYIFYPAQLRLAYEDINFSGIVSENYDNPMDLYKRYVTGFPQPEFIATLTNSPSFRFVTTDIGKVLSWLNYANTFAYCPVGAIEVGFVQSTCPIRYGTAVAVHVKAAIAKSIIVIDSITWQQDGVAQATFTIHPLWNGSVRPVIWSLLATLPTVSFSTSRETYVGTYGSVKGAVMDSITSFNLSPNTSLDLLRADGDAWFTAASIKQQEPTIEVETLNASWVQGTDVEGNSAVTSSFVGAKFYLRRIGLDAFGSSTVLGGRLIDAEVFHILFAMNQTHYAVGGASASGPNDPVKAMLRFNPFASDSYPPIAVSQTVAITVP